MFVRVLDQNSISVSNSVRSLDSEATTHDYIEVYRVVSVTADDDGCKRAHIIDDSMDGYMVTAQPGESIEFYN